MSIQKVTLARHAGFCFGVRRAVEAAKAAAPAVTLGPVIHNAQVVEELRGLGEGEAERERHPQDGVLGGMERLGGGEEPGVLEPAHARGAVERGGVAV